MMKQSRSPAILRTVIIGALALGGAGMGMQRVAAHMRGRAFHGYVPAPAIPRLSFLGDAVPDAMLIRDFDTSGDELFLLDGASPRVIAMVETNGHWSTLRTFGRRGGGPGELMQPTGLAVIDDTVIIADRDRLHYFSRGGRYLRTRAPLLPCPLMEPHVNRLHEGLLLSGRCMRGDTIASELLYVDSSDSIRAVAHEPLYTTDGSFGSIFGAGISYTPGASHGLFGAGTGDCVYRVEESSTTGPPSIRRVCGASVPRYAFVASPEFKAKARAIAAARSFAAGAFTVPELLPSYIGTLSTSTGDVVLRPFSNDSFAFRTPGTVVDIMIGEVDGFIGCRAAGCLWVRHETVPQVMFVPTAVIQGAMKHRE